MNFIFLCIFIATATAAAAVTEIKVAAEYLPPDEKAASEVEPELSAATATATLGDDGYQYKSVRHLRYRQMRDVAEVINKYLPPAAVENVEKEYLPPPPAEENTAEETAAAVSPEEAQDTAVLADDGYHYKTVRRLKYRKRRDISKVAKEYLPPPTVEAAQEEYLPPSEEASTEDAVSIEAAQDSAILADDGYHYKTIRRLKYRQSRDVSEIANEYLPPAEEAAAPLEQTVEKEYLPPTEEGNTEAPFLAHAAQDTAILADDGYHYKTVRRLKYRQRRDVSEVTNEYLPPVEEAAIPAEETVEKEYLPPSEEVKSEESVQDSAVLADDGYHYKTVRRLKYRQRRDVSEVANEYLPPAEETIRPAEETVQREYLPPTEEANTEAPILVEATQDTAILADDGYHYKTVRRLKYRQRRDVSEIANEYLPPAEETALPVEETVEKEYLGPSHEAVQLSEAAQDTAVLADDGYHYKTIRRLKYRKRRDVSEILEPKNDYLPPVAAAAVIDIPVLPKEALELEQDTAVLKEDGYHYKQPREAVDLAAAFDLRAYNNDDTIVVEASERNAELSNNDTGLQNDEAS